jgi:hypothetical protein
VAVSFVYVRLSVKFDGVRVGIDSDIKLWAPTAAEPTAPGRRAERIMAENRQQQVADRWIWVFWQGSDRQSQQHV